MWNIKVRVSGGVTGTREALYKSGGKVMAFATREEAEQAAAKYRREMNVPHACASYQAFVVEDWEAAL